jgi:NAD(P)-dependent dehydrogenase (short-subunit alcohol dehydrogenase family)
MDTVLNEGKGLEEHLKIWKGRTPMGRLGRRGDLDGAVVFLASEAGSFATGTDFKIDGRLFFPRWAYTAC